MIEAYPLAWPAGWRRSNWGQRDRARFGNKKREYSTTGTGSWTRKRDLTVADGTQRVLTALRMLGVLEGDAIISTNLAVRLDGLPRSGQGEPNDPGVAVYWERPGDNATKCMAVDRYDRVADNLAAVAATLEAMRSIERHGGAQILDRAFMGFAQLPAPGHTTVQGWRAVLGFPHDQTPPLADIENKYKSLRSKYHPDKPHGDAEKFIAVQTAFEQARQEIRA